MPLILMTGYPCSSKTTVAQELAAFLADQHKKEVVTVEDSNLAGFNRSWYVEPAREKELRGYLRSEVQRLLNRDRIVIVDSLNYIKGYRYEQFCIAKLCKTTYCVVHCRVSPEIARDFNAKRDSAQVYEPELLDSIMARYEIPESKNRWDSPLFQMDLPSDQPLPLDEIAAAILEGKTLRPNASTQCQPLSPTDFLQCLDHITQDIIRAIWTEQQTKAPGDMLRVPHADSEIPYERMSSMAELNRLRRQFIVYMKSRPTPHDFQNSLGSTFVTFINNQLK